MRPYAPDSIDYREHYLLPRRPLLWSPNHPLPWLGRRQRFAQALPVDLAFSNHDAVDQDDRDTEVIEAIELVVGIDIEDVGVEVELLKEAQGLVAEVAALPGDQNDVHVAEPTARRLGRQLQRLPHLDVGALEAVEALNLVHPHSHVIPGVACGGDAP